MIKLKPWHLGLSVFVLLFGGILVSAALNLWQTQGSRVPARFTDGDAAGEYRPDDIRGSYAFGDISSLFDIPLADLAAAFALPGDMDAALFQCKSLESLYESLADAGTEVGTASVRLFVALYTGLPYELDEEVYLLRPAVQILRKNAELTSAQLDYLNTHTVGMTGEQMGVAEPETEEGTGEEPGALETETHEPQNLQQSSTGSPEQDHEEGLERFIKGKTTFREVLDWGVTEETIEAVIGGDMPNPLTAIRDYCASQGLNFGEIKTALQAEVDKAGK